MPCLLRRKPRYLCVQRLTTSGGSRKKIFRGPGPSSFERQQRLSEITIEPLLLLLMPYSSLRTLAARWTTSLQHFRSQTICNTLFVDNNQEPIEPIKKLGEGLGKIWGEPVPPWPQHRTAIADYTRKFPDSLEQISVKPCVEQLLLLFWFFYSSRATFLT